MVLGCRLHLVTFWESLVCQSDNEVTIAVEKFNKTPLLELNEAQFAFFAPVSS